jgi:tetratricopeptide (TPR) repeat protein
MRSLPLIAAFCFAICLSLTGYLEPWSQSSRTSRSGNVLNMLIGDSRRLFANHFFSKADAYFHSGYYPSIFDQAATEEQTHMEQMAAEKRHDQSEEKDHQDEESGFLGSPKNWIDAFGRNFYPSHHVHLEGQRFREILPWLRAAANLNPHKIETYIIGAYALRSRLHKPSEAESFLREGLRANPDSYGILFELGRIRAEDNHDPDGARNLWELALKKWQKEDADGKQPDVFVYQQTLGFLGALEEAQGRFDKAITYFEMLKKISPAKEALSRRIEELKQKRSAVPPR